MCATSKLYTFQKHLLGLRYRLDGCTVNEYQAPELIKTIDDNMCCYTDIMANNYRKYRPCV